MKDQTFTPSEKDFLAFLMEITDGGNKPCYRSNAWLSEQIGVSENTVDKILQKLREFKIGDGSILTADKNKYKEREIIFTGAKKIARSGFLILPSRITIDMDA